MRKRFLVIPAVVGLAALQVLAQQKEMPAGSIEMKDTLIAVR